MAWYTSNSVLQRVNGSNTWWNTIYGPADKVAV